jgi:hypothetical protein
MSANRHLRLKGTSISEGEQPTSSRLPAWIKADATKVIRMLEDAAIEDMKARYALGQLVHQIRYHSSVAHTAPVLTNLARVVHVHVTALRRYARVTEVIGPRNFAEFISLRTREGKPLTWSHIELLAEVRGETGRQDCAAEILSENLSVRELAIRVRIRTANGPSGARYRFSIDRTS